MKTGIYPAVLFILIFSMVAACASRQPVLTIDQADEQLTLVIKASNFAFIPAHIRVFPGKKIMLSVENTSGTEHNFTLKDPGGRVIQDLPLTPNETATAELSLGEPGTYPFYCDRPFHSTFGMNGTIEVLPGE